MNIHAILHVPYEGTGLIKEWIQDQHHVLTESLPSDSRVFPATDDFDALIVMGGPMGVHDDDRYPWLRSEKALIRDALQSGKKVLGICLGAQLIAHCLDARVYKNPEPEIGWYPVRKKFFMHSWFPVFDDDEKEYVFHWHGDTFDLPRGSILLFDSDGCKNQAFAIEDRVLALQFHPEITEEMIGTFIEHGRNDLKPARYIQSESRMISNFKLYGETSRSLLFDLLDGFFME